MITLSKTQLIIAAAIVILFMYISYTQGVFKGQSIK